jgi:hypothetical protein
LADLGKLYEPSTKYKDEMYDIFDTKFVIAKDYCQKIGIGGPTSIRPSPS